MLGKVYAAVSLTSVCLQRVCEYILSRACPYMVWCNRIGIRQIRQAPQHKHFISPLCAVKAVYVCVIRANLQPSKCFRHLLRRIASGVPRQRVQWCNSALVPANLAEICRPALGPVALTPFSLKLNLAKTKGPEKSVIQNFLHFEHVIA